MKIDKLLLMSSYGLITRNDEVIMNKETKKNAALMCISALKKNNRDNNHTFDDDLLDILEEIITKIDE